MHTDHPPRMSNLTHGRASTYLRPSRSLLPWLVVGAGPLAGRADATNVSRASSSDAVPSSLRSSLESIPRAEATSIGGRRHCFGVVGRAQLFWGARSEAGAVGAQLVGGVVNYHIAPRRINASSRGGGLVQDSAKDRLRRWSSRVSVPHHPSVTRTMLARPRVQPTILHQRCQGQLTL